MNKSGNNRKYVLVFLAILLLTVLTGCMKGDFHITINGDGSGDLDYKIAFDSTILTLANGKDGNPLDNFKKNFEKEGYQVSLFKDGDMQGVQAKKHVNDVSTLQNISARAGGLDTPNKIQIIKTNGILKDKYIVNANLDLSEMKPSKDDDMGIEKMMLSKIDLKFTLTLPYVAGANNSSRTLDNGKTYQWDLIVGQPNEIKIEFEKTNFVNVLT